MKYLKFCLFLVFTLVLAVSCKKDIADLEPQAQEVTNRDDSQQTSSAQARNDEDDEGANEESDGEEEGDEEDGEEDESDDESEGEDDEDGSEDGEENDDESDEESEESEDEEEGDDDEGDEESEEGEDDGEGDEESEDDETEGEGDEEGEEDDEDGGEESEDGEIEGSEEEDDEESEEDETEEEGEEEDSDTDVPEGSDDCGGEVGLAAINVASTVINGTPNVDKIQGFFGDDVISGGGGGGEAYVVSAGNDVITDFNPAEDVLMINDFGPMGKYEELGVTTIRNLSDLQALSTNTTINGQPAVVIDVDANLGDWTTTLLGVRLEDLSNINVIFTFDESEWETVHPISDFTHIPAVRMVATDGSVLNSDAHGVPVHPIIPTLESGTQEAYNNLFCVITYGGID